MAKSIAFQTVPTLPIRVDAGILSVFDANRNKFLSVDRKAIVAGKLGRAKNIYLRSVDGIANNVSSFPMPRGATVVSLSARSASTSTAWKVHLRKNGDPTNLFTLNVTSGSKSNILVDVDLAFDDILQFYVETSAFLGIRHPTVWAEIAWKVV